MTKRGRASSSVGDSRILGWSVGPPRVGGAGRHGAGQRRPSPGPRALERHAAQRACVPRPLALTPTRAPPSAAALVAAARGVRGANREDRAQEGSPS